MLRAALIAFGLCVFCEFAEAHDPNLATFSISHRNGVWLLEMSCAQAGLNNALVADSPELVKLLSTDKDYKEAVVAYLKRTILIQANVIAEVKLGQGGIKIGNHQSDVKFVLEGIPDDLKELKIQLLTMTENPQHVSLLKVYVDGDSQRYLLDRSNGYEATFSLN